MMMTKKTTELDDSNNNFVDAELLLRSNSNRKNRSTKTVLLLVLVVLILLQVPLFAYVLTNSKPHFVYALIKGGCYNTLNCNSQTTTTTIQGRKMFVLVFVP